MAGVSTGERPTAEIDHDRPASPWMPGGWFAVVGFGVLVASAGSGVSATVVAAAGPGWSPR